MDSFEARVYLTKQLSSLTPSKQAAQQCAKFLLKHKELQEDLYSVILESLDAADLNIRINIFQFLEELIVYCQNDSQKPYVSSIVKDMRLILTKILPPKPDDVSCETRLLTNLHAAYTILVNISKSCMFTNLKEYKAKYSSNLLTDMDRNRIELQLQFDEKPLYTEKELPDSIDTQLESPCTVSDRALAGHIHENAEATFGSDRGRQRTAEAWQREPLANKQGKWINNGI
ncbi:hypothetical protein KL910_000985 [Ogataea haglerorum]|nr:hypothetical protein KL910_000985 [Ogataea haglerorum]KAG7793141.1 hypothetical protein KL945_000246 [Ogataea haglerorum]